MTDIPESGIAETGSTAIRVVATKATMVSGTRCCTLGSIASHNANDSPDGLKATARTPGVDSAAHIARPPPSKCPVATMLQSGYSARTDAAIYAAHSYYGFSAPRYFPPFF